MVRTGAALTAVRSSDARAKARPGCPSCQAAIVEPARLIFGEACRQDLGLPGGGRGLEALELCHDDLEGVRPLHACIGGDALPAEQKTHEVARGDRLDLGTQALDRVVVDARKQPTLAPFVSACLRREAAAHDEALGLELCQGGFDPIGREPERYGECALRDRPLTLQATAQDLDQRGLA